MIFKSINKNVVLIFTMLILSTVIVSCGDRVVENIPVTDYYPLSIDQEMIYQIDSVHYSDFGLPTDSFRYYRKEHVSSIADLPSSSDRFSVDVFYKTDTTDWYYHSSFITYKDAFRAVRKTDNMEVMNLLFPYKNRVYWDGNQLNNSQEDRFRYNESILYLAELRDSFPNTIIVEQQLDTNIIEKKIRWEVYAADIGLIEKKTVLIDIQQDKRKGFYYHWKLIAHK